MKSVAASALGYLFAAGLLPACGAVPPSYPGVSFVMPSERTSERLHTTCEYLDVLPTATPMDAGAAAVQRGGDTVMPLGGARTESDSRIASGRYVLHTQSWASTTMVAIFRCGDPTAVR